MTPETPKEETRLVTLYRLRAEQAEYNAETWCKVGHLLMQQNQENASGIDQIRHHIRTTSGQKINRPQDFPRSRLNL